MKELWIMLAIILIIGGGLTWLYIAGDASCMKQDLIDVRTMHPDWSQEQIEAQARMVHKGHQYRGGGSYQ